MTGSQISTLGQNEKDPAKFAFTIRELSAKLSLTSDYMNTLLPAVDSATARTTLGVAYGITAGTVAQGNDSRFASALQIANNLSDLGSVAAAQLTLRINGRSQHGDADTTLTAADGPFIQLNAALTAIRTWTLPLSNALPAGTSLTINDGGGINGANTLKVQRQGTNTFNGIGVAANSITIGTVFGSITVMNDGAAGWNLTAKT